MHRQRSRARFFFAVTVLLIALGSTSAIAERVTFPIESSENLKNEVFMGTLKDVAGAQGVKETTQFADAKAATDTEADRSSERKMRLPEKGFDH